MQLQDAGVAPEEKKTATRVKHSCWRAAAAASVSLMPPAVSLVEEEAEEDAKEAACAHADLRADLRRAQKKEPMEEREGFSAGALLQLLIQSRK